MAKYNIPEVMDEMRSKASMAEHKITEFVKDTIAELRKETGTYVESIEIKMHDATTVEDMFRNNVVSDTHIKLSLW